MATTVRSRKSTARPAEGINVSDGADSTASAAAQEGFPFDVVKLLPAEFLQKSTLKAVGTMVRSLLGITVGYVALVFVPWYLMPLVWIYIGTAITGLFAIAYACRNHALFERKYVNDIVGWVATLPLLTNFEAWKQIQRKTRLTATPLWFLSSLWECIKTNFHLAMNTRIMGNGLAVVAFALIFTSAMVYYLGVWGFAKFYVIPLLVYHFELSVYHKANYNTIQAAFKKTTDNLNEAFVTRFPRWQSLLSNNMNVLASSFEQICSEVPTYNWDSAYKALKSQLGEKVKERSLLSDLYVEAQHYYSVAKLINWPTISFLTFEVVALVVACFVWTYDWRTMLVAFISYYIGGVGITAGYHRLWSHRSYDARLPMRLILLFMGTGAVEGSVIKWSCDHRQHHRHTDTDKDPYNAKRGFFFSHLGWMLWANDISTADVSDLKKDPVLRWQHEHYVPLAMFVGVVLPTMICGFGWGDWTGGFLVAGMVKCGFLHHVTFFINSLAHYWGDATFSDQRTPRDSYAVSLLTFGEGYHNFHHEFPYDYRNGLYFYHYDPGKWVIALGSMLGQAYNLKRFPDEVFQKGKLKMKQKKIDEEKVKFNWGPAADTLPYISMLDVENRRAEGAQLIVVEERTQECCARNRFNLNRETFELKRKLFKMILFP